jgi:hypothetical protein
MQNRRQDWLTLGLSQLGYDEGDNLEIKACSNENQQLPTKTAGGS